MAGMLRGSNVRRDKNLKPIGRPDAGQALSPARERCHRARVEGVELDTVPPRIHHDEGGHFVTRSVPLSIAGLVFAFGLCFADPGLQVTEVSGGIRVQLEGSFAQSTYTVLRSAAQDAPYVAITQRDVLCTGDCYATDFDVVPGVTYFYRFDVLHPDGTLTRFGPYPVTLPDHPVGVRVAPNPGAGATRVEFSLPGAAQETPVPAEARLVDLQGRVVKVLYRGVLARGVTSMAWDGADDRGRPLGAGVYFLRLSTPLGTRVSRIVRAR
jgi:hypothetical protein